MLEMKRGCYVPRNDLLQEQYEISGNVIYANADDSSPLHKNVYYIDGLTAEHSLVLLERYGELLINDGLCQFGFGLHNNTAELMSNKYNLLSLWTSDIPPI